MNRNRKEAKQRTQTLQIWTREQAVTALPYIRSVMESLREPRLLWLRHEATVRRLAEKQGRPDRTTLIALEEARREAARAAERFNEALEELQILDIYCLDPLGG